MCGRAIRCITKTFCDTLCDAITYFACHVPIYSCVGSIFNSISECCVNLWHSQNTIYPPTAAAAIAHPAVAIPVAYPAEPVLIPVAGASDQHHEGLGLE